MFGKHFTTLRWVIIWGIIAIIANSTGTIWGSWAAVMAAVFSGLGLVYGVFRWLTRKYRLHELFDVYYEQRIQGKDEKIYSYTTVASNSTQTVRVTLLLKADINIKFINLDFAGNGQKPVTDEPYDHNLGQAHPDFRWLQRSNDDSWNAQIIRGALRNRDQYIYIGVKFTASQLFNGYLEVCLSSEEGARKHLYLPFNVVKGWDDGALRTNANGDIIFLEGGNMVKTETKLPLSRKQFHKILTKAS